MYIDSSKDKNGTPVFIRILFTCGGALAGFLIFFIFFASFRMYDIAMTPTLKQGGIVILRKIGPVKQGDIIVMRSPLQPEKIFFRRVAATENMLVSLKEKKLTVDGSVLNAPLHYSDSRLFSPEISPRDTMNDLTVPKNNIFVIGDNFDMSFDSRFFGPVNKKHIIGTVLFTF